MKPLDDSMNPFLIIYPIILVRGLWILLVVPGTVVEGTYRSVDEVHRKVYDTILGQEDI